jgi:hypothetical protein
MRRRASETCSTTRSATPADDGATKVLVPCHTRPARSSDGFSGVTNDVKSSAANPSEKVGEEEEDEEEDEVEED